MKRIPLNMSVMKKIDEVYSRIPAIACKRLCQDCCGQVIMTDFEYQRIVNRAGRNPPMPRSINDPCHYLKGGLCKVRDIRPALCRLWGVVDNPIMKCPYGCVPERWLSDEEASIIMDEIQRLGTFDEDAHPGAAAENQRRTHSTLDGLLHAAPSLVQSLPPRGLRHQRRLSRCLPDVDVQRHVGPVIIVEGPSETSLPDGVPGAGEESSGASGVLVPSE